VRCFLVKETKRGIQVAQSSSPSCHTDLHSSLAAHRTFKAQPHKILRLKIFYFLLELEYGGCRGKWFNVGFYLEGFLLLISRKLFFTVAAGFSGQNSQYCRTCEGTQ
jgi:hypothetical protein